MHLFKHVEELHEISGDMKLDGFLSLDSANSKVANLSVALFLLMYTSRLGLSIFM